MFRQKIDLTQNFLVTSADHTHLSQRPLPAAPDGLYDYEVLAAGEKGNDDLHSKLYSLVSKIQAAASRGLPIDDPAAIGGFLNALTSPDAIDDRKGMFTTALAAITKLPEGKLQDKLNNAAMTTLYETLPHPPSTYVGPQYAFRLADGGGNNPQLPDLGRAGLPYARSVQGKHPLPLCTLPDPGLVFDTLLKARDFQPHPGRNSSLTFAFASIVTHSLFRTDPLDWSKNNTSSYLDLSPLYGFNQVTQDQVRDKSQGRGILYPDTYSEDRLGFLPPAASALLVIFSRNHNYIAEMLLKINERKQWSDPPPTDASARAKQDEEIFQTARLINCGHFMSLVFGDYVAGFLGLGRDGNTWSMNPFDPIKTGSGQQLGRGEGNHVSVEFNLLYRWHATTAREDIEWTEEEFKQIFKSSGKSLDQIDLMDFKVAARHLFSAQDPDPTKREFGGIKRGSDGMFADDDLAKILHDATEKVAGAYRARGTPAALRIIEIMGMVQARHWGACSMNEFRKFLGLKQFDSFEEWAGEKNPEIAHAARQLYGHINNLELYPGLQAEECMDLGPGSGICCGYTMTRAILADAITLVRGDRYYTHDFTPANLTCWGFQDCVRDPNNGAFGAALPKLLMRHLPRHYPSKSVYTLFPFFTPDVTRKNLTKLGIVDEYEFSRPITTSIPKVLSTLAGIRYVLNDPLKFNITYEYDLDLLTKGYGFMRDADKQLVWRSLFPSQAATEELIGWYKEKMSALIKEKSISYDGVRGKYVDIVGNVLNLTAMHFAADRLCGISIKTADNPKGLFTEQEVYGMFATLFTCVYLNSRSENQWTLRRGAATISRIVNGIIEQNLRDVTFRNSKSPINKIFNTVKGTVWPIRPKQCDGFMSNLLESGRPMRELAACTMNFSVISSMVLAQAIVQVVDFYLDDARTPERATLVEVCKGRDAKSLELLRGYSREGMRLSPQSHGLLRSVAQNDSIPQGEGFEPLFVKKGDTLYANLRDAHLNPDDFPNPTMVDPTRPKSSYLLGAGFHPYQILDLIEEIVPEVLRVIFTLPNVRRAPIAVGTFMSFNVDVLGASSKMYVTNTGNISPWSGSLILVYDD